MRPLPVLSVRDIRNAADLDHYTLGAYDTTEPWQLRIIVVIPGLAAPAWVVPPRTRKGQARRPRKTLALALPNLSALTLEMAQAHTNVVTDFMGVREFSHADRTVGRIRAGALVPVPWDAEQKAA